MSLADRIDADLAALLGHGNDQAVTDARKLLAEIVAEIKGDNTDGA